MVWPGIVLLLYCIVAKDSAFEPFEPFDDECKSAPRF